MPKLATHPHAHTQKWPLTGAIDLNATTKTTMGSEDAAFDLTCHRLARRGEGLEAKLYEHDNHWPMDDLVNVMLHNGNSC